jgi:hypothetical protein
MLTRCSLLQSDIFRPRIKTRLCLKMRPLVLNKAIMLSFVTLWQVRTCSIALCLSLPSHSLFPSYRVSLVFFVSDQVQSVCWCYCRAGPVCIKIKISKICVFITVLRATKPSQWMILSVTKHCQNSIERDQKRWTQFRTSIFPELYMVCKWST